MQETIIYDQTHKPSFEEKMKIIDFLYDNLEQYTDPKVHIEKAIDYALKEFSSFGGSVFVIKEKNRIAGAAVTNSTGMDGYIPENILVYIAVNIHYRGKGIGKELLQTIINHVSGDIALHVDAGNPAKDLYEKFGFTNPYLEMRLIKK